MYQKSKIAVAVALALNAMSAFAQAQTDAVTARVEVTGSRIRTVDLETAQPVLKMTADQIQSSGLITVGDILNQLTSAGPPDFSKGATLTSNREQGGQYINFRNLGAERLLVLVDGKRWTQSVDGFTDMSTVPSSMIERIEVLKDGASAIYGSDAIAGVVNIILKKRMVGGNISAYKGQNEKGDGKTEDFALSYGAVGDQGSLMFGLSHNKQDTVWARDRDITAYGTGPANPEDGLGVGQFGRIRAVDARGAATGFNKYLNHAGSWREPGLGADSRNLANYHDFAGAADDKFNSTNQMMFQSPTKLTSIFTKGTYDISDKVRFTTTAMFAERTSSTQNAGYPLNSLTKPDFPVYISKDSYYNPYGNQVAGAGLGQDLFFYRRITEVPRVTENRNQTLHVDAALEGEFTAAGRTFNWDVGYNHSKVNGVVKGTGNVNLINLKSALGPSFLNANGAVQCGTPTSPIPLTSCTPFNIIGGPGASGADVFKYIMSQGQGTYGSTTDSATANITGELLQLPAGALSVAGGLEHREVRGYDQPGQFEQSGYSTDLGAFTTAGRYTVKEAYLEANVPLLKDVPFAKLLSLNLASRYSDYSNFGSTTNSKASFMWKPVDDLLLRGTWAEGFRAPALGDTFGGGSQSYDTYIDICDSQFGRAKAEANIAANCLARGVPATFRQKNATGTNITSATGAQTPYAFSTGLGNTQLQPETAKTKTLGFVYNPNFVPGLSVGLDWFKITVANRITAINVKYTLEQCYIYSIAEYCGNVQRDATGQITNLVRGNKNLGSMETEGLDLSLNYRLPRTPYGLFAVRTESTYLKAYDTKSTADAPTVSYAGEYGYARFKTNASLDWSLGNWSATYTMRYTSGQKDSCYTDDIDCSNPNDLASFGAYNKVGSLTYSDLSVGYNTAWKGKILVGANNLFDKKPRVIYNGSSSGTVVDPDLPIDRFFYVRYNQAF